MNTETGRTRISFQIKMPDSAKKPPTRTPQNEGAKEVAKDWAAIKAKMEVTYEAFRRIDQSLVVIRQGIYGLSVLEVATQKAHDIEALLKVHPLVTTVFIGEP
jgi:hypothetical protein